MEPSPTITALKKAIRSLFLTHIGDYVRSLYLQRQMRKLPVEQFAQVLDAGCGDGNYVLHMAERYPHLHVTGVDIMEFRGSCPFPNATLVQGDLVHLADRECYDFIYCIDVLEHIPNNIKVLKNISGALKQGGYLYLHMPNRIAGKHILPAMFLEDFQKWEKDEHIGEMYTLEEIKTIVGQNNLEVLAAQHTFGSLGQLAWELDRMTDRILVLKAMLMPFLKALAQLAVRLPVKDGDLMVVARKRKRQRQ